MAKSATSLTKYKSAVTIVTADVANAWYGGLYGSSEASGLSANDPLVAGHIHDGQHIDGHAQKIDLVDHVTNQIRNVNIGDDAVDKRTVNKFETQADAIPEYEIIDSVTYYYLDLSILRSEITNSSPFQYTGPVTDTVRYSTSDGPDNATTKFVISSTTTNYNGTNGSRLFYDPANAAFRFGYSDTTSWNSGNLGYGSVVFGYNSGSASYLAVVGGEENSTSGGNDASYATVLNGISNQIAGSAAGGDYSTILNGNNNQITDSSVAAILAGGQFSFFGGKGFTAATANIIDSTSHWSVIVGGGSNVIGANDETIYSTIAGGRGNQIDGASGNFIGAGEGNFIDNRISSAIVTGENNIISLGNYTIIGGGDTNSIDGDYSGIFVGQNNSISGGTHNFIGAGDGNTIDGGISDNDSAIVAGQTNAIDSSDAAFIGAGRNNNIQFTSSLSAIVSGQSNRIGNTSTSKQVFHSFIGAGQTNIIEEYWSAIVAGQNNTINDNAQHTFIGAGSQCTIGDGTNSTDHSAIVGGEINAIYSEWAFIGSGENNTINDAADHSIIVGGELNVAGDGSTNSINNVIVGGFTNNTEGIYATIVNGNTNSALGNYNIVVGGQTNSALVGTHHIIGGGQNHNITENVNTAASPTYNGIFSGLNNDMWGADWVISGTIAAAGSGYNQFETVSVTSGTGQPATFVILTVGGSGEITSIDLLHRGNYLVNPSTPSGLTGGSGTGATINVTMARSGSPEYSVVAGGSNNIVGHASYSIIGAGQGNDIYVADHSGILSGLNNIINGSGDQGAELVYANFSVIAGGEDNVIETGLQEGSEYSFIGNGDTNLITSAKHAVILNGVSNTATQFLITLNNPSYPTILNGDFHEIEGFTSYSLIGNGSTNKITGGAAGSNFGSTILNGLQNTINANANYSTILSGTDNTVSAGSDNSVLFGIENIADNSHIFGFGNYGTAAYPYSFYISSLAFDDSVADSRGQAQHSICVGRTTATSPDTTYGVVFHEIGADDYSLHVVVDYTCYKVSGGTPRTATGTYVAHVYDSNGAGTYTITNIPGPTYQSAATLAGALIPTLSMSGVNGTLIFNVNFTNATDLTSYVCATMKVTRVWNDGTAA